MLYRFLRILVGFALKCAFKGIRINGLENIPDRKSPALLISNHPIGFLEPLVIACNLPPDLWYLARGDFFKKAIQRFLMNSVHILPIYRFRDGFSEMRKNESAIQHTLDKLKEGKKFLIFAEGSTKLQRSIRPIQKGTARIVAEAYETNMLERLPIIPIGFTITKTDGLRGEVFIQIGKPIDTKVFFEQSASIPKSIKSLTKTAQTELESLVPHVGNDHKEDLLDHLIRLNENGVFSMGSLINLSEKINATTEEDIQFQLEKMNTLKTLLLAQSMKTNGIGYVKKNLDLKINPFTFLSSSILKIYGYIPYSLAKLFANKKVNMPEFYVVILFVANIVTFILWGIFTCSVAYFLFGKPGIIVSLTFHVLMRLIIPYLDKINAYKGIRKFNRIPLKQKEVILTTMKDMLTLH